MKFETIAIHTGDSHGKVEVGKESSGGEGI
jgi:hypothetical protein